LRMSYWVYVIFERRALVPMLSPTLFGRVMGIADFLPTAWIPLLHPARRDAAIV